MVILGCIKSPRDELALTQIPDLFQKSHVLEHQSSEFYLYCKHILGLDHLSSAVHQPNIQFRAI